MVVRLPWEAPGLPSPSSFVVQCCRQCYPRPVGSTFLAPRLLALPAVASQATTPVAVRVQANPAEQDACKLGMSCGRTGKLPTRFAGLPVWPGALCFQTFCHPVWVTGCQGGCRARGGCLRQLKDIIPLDSTMLNIVNQNAYESKLLMVGHANRCRTPFLPCRPTCACVRVCVHMCCWLGQDHLTAAGKSISDFWAECMVQVRPVCLHLPLPLAATLRTPSWP